MTSRLAPVFVAMIVWAASVGTARAQAVSSDEHARRLAAAVEARKVAQAAKTREAFAACGQAYLAAYNADPLWAHGDELLWTAGWCFEDAQSLGPSIVLYEMVAKYYPRSVLAARALGRVGRVYADLAMFDRAADRLERYATTYPGELDAYLALEDAIRYRAGLGERDKRIELTSFYVKTFGAQRPHRAAAVFYALTEVYANEVERQISHLKEYLRRFQLTTAEQIIALARLGELVWTRACPMTTSDGLCVAERRPPASGDCGSAMPPVTYAVVKRGTRDRRQALAYFQAAIDLQQQQHETNLEARQASASARRALADDALEHALPVTAPNGLAIASQDPSLRSRQRAAVDRWLADRRRAVDKAVAAYRAGGAMHTGVPHIDAAATHVAQYRTARATELLWHAVTTVRLPGNAESACPILLDLVRPLREQTMDAYRACAANAVEAGGQTPAVMVCLRAREAWGLPDDPPQRERVAEPTWGGGVIVVEPPLTHTPW